jgi:hypothetical protein
MPFSRFNNLKILMGIMKRGVATVAATLFII